jgi:hypothetical protein
VHRCRKNLPARLSVNPSCIRRDDDPRIRTRISGPEARPSQRILRVSLHPRTFWSSSRITGAKIK